MSSAGDTQYRSRLPQARSTGLKYSAECGAGSLHISVLAALVRREGAGLSRSGTGVRSAEHPAGMRTPRGAQRRSIPPMRYQKAHDASRVLFGTEMKNTAALIAPPYFNVTSNQITILAARKFIFLPAYNRSPISYPWLPA